MKALGASMRQLREDMGWSLTRAAEETGLSRIAIRSWEVGVRNPPIDAISQWLGGFRKRLVVVGVNDTVIGLQGAGQLRAEYCLVTGDGIEVQQPSRSAAEGLAAAVPGSRVAYRILRIGSLEYARGEWL
jgi:transcriptional regulator with XRE-family HTH domain